ncbi:Asx homology domain-containing protein [Xylaria sp. FL1042]|nr:Asx homology domain-containing protein [Xylaria sp. FL1042]
MMKHYRIRDRSTTPSNTNSSPDELDTPSGTHHNKRPGSDEEVLDEIVVSRTLQNKDAKVTNSNGETAIRNNIEETPKGIRRSSRVSSISIRGSPAAPSSDKSVTMKKQEFGIVTSGNDDGKPDELELPTPSKKRKVNPDPTPRVASRKNRSKWDNPDEMLTNPNSPLVKAKLRELLCCPMAWEALSSEEKEQVVSKFPDDLMILDPGTSNARPDIAALLNNNNFRNDVTRYQEGLGRGFHDPEWIQQAQSAHRAREMGIYDDFMAADFEEKWDMPMPKQANGHQVDNVLEGQAKGAPIELGTAAPSEDPATKDQGANDMLEGPSTDISHEKSIDICIQNRNDNIEDKTESKVAPTDNTSTVEEEKDKPIGGDKNQGEPDSNETTVMPESTESASQKLEGPIPGAEVSATQSLPDVMKGVEHQSAEKQPENTEIKQVDAQVAESAEDEATQIIVTNGT